MICRHIRLVTFTLACLFLSGELQGAVVERGWHLAGDGRVTYDTLSGREWLDLPETFEISVTQLQALLEPGGSLAGFVPATRQDVESFLTSAGFVAPQLPGDQDYDLAIAFIDLVGGFSAEGGLIGEFRYASGRYATAAGLAGDESIYVHAFGTKPPPGTVMPLPFKTYGAGIDNSVFTELPPLGFWLYRPVAVPEPVIAGLLFPLLFAWPRLRRRGLT